MPLKRQVYIGLPDGMLAGYADDMHKMLAAIATDIAPDRLFTTGPNGYDGHPDHIATHAAAQHAVQGLRELGHEVVGWGLAVNHTGELRIAGDSARKTGAMALHASQIVAPDLIRWGNRDVYTPLIIGAETYVRQSAF